MRTIFISFCFWIVACVNRIGSISQADQLYRDLMVSYNRLIRPAKNVGDILDVKISLHLTQIIDLNLKEQVMSTNARLEQEWFDYKLRWNPYDYGGLNKLHLPADKLWLPDIVLHNNADYENMVESKVMILSNGLVKWHIPAIYKSICEINVKWFPFDSQSCFLKFITWSKNENLNIDLQNQTHTSFTNNTFVLHANGLDTLNFNAEWNILSTFSTRQLKQKHANPYQDISFKIMLKRKTLFYTINLILPCLIIGFLAIFVFYLPSNSNEKITLNVSLLISIFIFILVLSDFVPVNSLTTTFISKYLIFTLILTILSIVFTLIVLNVHFKYSTKITPWKKFIFLKFLPSILHMKRPEMNNLINVQHQLSRSTSSSSAYCFAYCNTLDKMRINSQNNSKIRLNQQRSSEDRLIHENDNQFDQINKDTFQKLDSLERTNSKINQLNSDEIRFNKPNKKKKKFHQYQNNVEKNNPIKCDEFETKNRPTEFNKAIFNLRFMYHYMQNLEDYFKLQEDWRFMANVLDRFFMIFLIIVYVIGWITLAFQAHSSHDKNETIFIE